MAARRLLRTLHEVARWLRRTLLEVARGLRDARVVLLLLVLYVAVQQTMLFFAAARADVAFTWGDAFLYAFRGMDEYDPLRREAFLLDAAWFLPQMALAYAACAQARHENLRYDAQLVVRLQGLGLWFSAKLVRGVCLACLFALMELAGSLACAAVLGGSAVSPLEVSESGLVLANVRFATESGFPEGTALLGAYGLALVELVLVTVAATALAFAFEPVGAFAAVAVLLIASAFFQTNALPFDYAMIVRNAVVASDGFTLGFGLAVCGAVALAAVALGAARLRKAEFV